MKSYEENIRNYSKQIKTMETYAKAVRETVGQFLGYTGNKGFINMIREIFQNSVDELMKEESPCDEIWLAYDETTKTIICKDNGRGIPFNDMHRVFSDPHTSSNYSENKKPGEFSSGRHGVGSKVVNAVSEFFIVESFVLGEARRISFHKGEQDGPIEVIKNKNNFQGTIVMFKPDYEIMGDITTTHLDVLALIKSIVPLLKIGAKINFSAVLPDNSSYKETIINQYGIITGLMHKTTNQLIEPIVFRDMNAEGTMRANIAFTYDSSSLTTEDITAFSNFCPTGGDSKHITGFLDGLTTYFRNYMNKIYLAKSKISCVNNDIKCGLKAILDVAHLYPIFSGQAKEVLSNDDMHPYIKGITIKYLEQWSKQNPSALQKLCKYFKDVAEIRLKSDKEKVKLSSSYQASVLSGLPTKYVKPTGKQHLELIITEGDSAAGLAKQFRDPARQGIFPIRGKMPNAYTTTRAKFLANEEVSSILMIIGAGYGQNFDIEKCKWEKVIIGADADPDGSHIRSLFLKFMLMYCQPLITYGRFYSLVPPLYGIKLKNKYKYFTQKIDFTKYVQQQFLAQYKIFDISGKPYSNAEITNLLVKNMEYAHTMRIISGTFAINPLILERCLADRNLPLSKIKADITKRFRFAEVSMQNNALIVDGLADNKMQRAIFNDRLIGECQELISYIDNSPKFFKMNDQIVTLYELMSTFDQFIPSNLTRYKGLGEMNGEQLKESTLHPDSNRTLIRYTVEDVKAEIEAIKALETDKSVLLKDIKITKYDLS